jgi:hypothetical protein
MLGNPLCPHHPCMLGRSGPTRLVMLGARAGPAGVLWVGDVLRPSGGPGAMVQPAPGVRGPAICLVPWFSQHLGCGGLQYAWCHGSASTWGAGACNMPGAMVQSAPGVRGRHCLLVPCLHCDNTWPIRSSGAPAVPDHRHCCVVTALPECPTLGPTPALMTGIPTCRRCMARPATGSWTWSTLALTSLRCYCRQPSVLETAPSGSPRRWQ